MQRRTFLSSLGAASTVAALQPSLLSAADAPERPNILWLTCEDNSVAWLGCYGNKQANTPNIDQLAAEGFQYMHTYASAPVCAPSRSTWITGVNALSMGTHPMRSRYEIPHNKIRYYPDYLKENGYYCGNSTKTDYNIGGRPDKETWDNPGNVNWEDLPENQPFFQVVNSTSSHESRAFGDIENTTHDPADTTLAAYHPDIPDMRKNYAKYHDCISKMDGEIGASLKKLEELGLADNTIVVHNSDHGGVLARSKRFLFDSGIHCPLIIRIPEKLKHLYPAEKPGMKVDRLVSFVDMPKTWLSITGSEIPDVMQGNIFLGPGAEPEKRYHHAFRGRMDERYDNLRAVHDKRFLFIKNYMPYAPWGHRLEYLWKMKATLAWQAYHDAGKTDAITGRFFGPKPHVEELYDTVADPDNVHNLIESPEYAATVADMRASLTQWQLEVHDAGLLPEADMVKRAKDNGTTIYEMVRNEKLYDLPGLMAAADLALAKTPANLSQLKRNLKSQDSGVRYWATVGIFLLGEKAASAKAAMIERLADDSHEVRIMAAWQLVQIGEKEKGLACLSDLLKSQSYASLKAMNVLDWMGDDGLSVIPELGSIKMSGYSSKIRATLFLKAGLKLPSSTKGKSRRNRKAKN